MTLECALERAAADAGFGRKVRTRNSFGQMRLDIASRPADGAEPGIGRLLIGRTLLDGVDEEGCQHRLHFAHHARVFQPRRSATDL